MTREEAIALLNCTATEMVGTLGEGGDVSAVNQSLRYIEALDMAIAALREPKLPCKPGDTVYRLCGQRGHKYVAERKVVSVALCGEQSWQILTTAHDWLGHNVFLTREEAEAKLRRLEEVCLKD